MTGPAEGDPTPGPPADAGDPTPGPPADAGDPTPGPPGDAADPAGSSSDTDTDTGADNAQVPTPVPADQRSRRRWIGRGLLVAGVLILLCAGWVSWRTYQAYRHLNAAATAVSTLQSQVKSLDSLDVTKVDAAVATLRTEADKAVDASSDPLYRVAAHLPWVGPSLRAVSDIADTVDGLARTTAPSLLQVAKAIQPAALAPKDGVIDLAPITGAAGALQSADAQVRAAQDRMAAIDRGPLVGPVARAVGTLDDKLVTLSGTTGAAARIGRLAPPMLGATSVRRYLVAFQNLAEPRATGGIFGSYVLLEVRDGRLTITDQGSGSRDLGTFDPALTLPSTLPTALYGQLPGRYATDTNLTPDFPTAASLLARMYTARKHVPIDGVLAIDPVALSYLLTGTSPIDVGHGIALTSNNITEVLLSRAYALFPKNTDAPARDVFLDAATGKAFAAVTTSTATARSTLKGLTRAAAEHRLLLWSAHASEQKDLASTEVAGQLPDSDAPAPVIGVYRNDATGGKLGYYATGSAGVTSGSCDSAGRRELTVTVHMKNTGPASGLSSYVLGYAKAGPYVLRTNLLVFAPVSADFTSLTVAGQRVPVVWAEQSGRRVGMITVDLKPGAATTVTGTFTVPAPRSGGVVQPRLVLTPGVKAWPVSASAYSAC